MVRVFETSRCTLWRQCIVLLIKVNDPIKNQYTKTNERNKKLVAGIDLNIYHHPVRMLAAELSHQYVIGAAPTPATIEGFFGSYFAQDRFESTIGILCDLAIQSVVDKTTNTYMVGKIIHECTSSFDTARKLKVHETLYQWLDGVIGSDRYPLEALLELFSILDFHGCFHYFKYLQRLISSGAWGMDTYKVAIIYLGSEASVIFHPAENEAP